MSNAKHDRGSAEIELVLGVAFILIPISMLVLLIPQWPESQTAARSSAKEAATLIVGASDAASGVEAAQQAVDRAATNLDQDLTMSVTGEWCRGCEITVTVTVVVPAIVIPGIGTTGAVDWSASSTARIDDYRSLDTL
ncbi:MAG: hypothetical protein ACE37B_11725 [Ilumatobacter sp.]|uniref:hypothetical protein n=1 Tax=Ilumatobacter sp. TaxID=1967498 RepID=UPI00391BF592